MGDLTGIFILLALGILFSVLLNAYQTRKKRWLFRPAAQGPFYRRAKRTFIVGTDNDLKIELFFLVYVSLAIILVGASFSQPRYSFQLLPALLSLILGFHFRQWLSKWRLLNIVSMRRMASDASLVWKANSTLAFGLTNVLLIYVLYLNPYYAPFQVVGIFIHEMAFETRKNTLVLRRRLHLFDLESFAEDQETAAIIHKITRPFGLSRLGRLISSEENPQRRLALRAFKELLTNDQKEFRRILEDNMTLIMPDSDLCYYFGRALYSLGDIAAAEKLLKAGSSSKPDVRCAAYLALIALAPGKNREGAEKARAILKPYLEGELESTSAGTTTYASAGRMFAHAYYALASIMLADVEANLSTPEAKDALYHIHSANRINERFLAKKTLGRLLSYSYYRGNELILMDICGYIIFRLGEPRLAYRILEGAVRADNTYPWPYFHIALIYERTGKHALAQSIFSRIALNERTESVVYRLSAARIKDQNGALVSAK